MAPRSVLHDAQVMADDGTLGRVKHVVLDEHLHEVTDLVVNQDGEEWLVPMSAVTHIEAGQITVGGERSHYQRAGSFNRDDYEVIDDDADANPEHGGEPAFPPASAASAERSSRGSAPPGYRLQLREERLRIATEPQQAGAVRVTKRAIEHTETVSVPVREERVVIEVMPGAGAVRVGDRELREGEALEVPLREERVVVDTEVVLSEDVTIRKEVIEHAEPVSATLLKEELVVDEQGEVTVESRDADSHPQR